MRRRPTSHRANAASPRPARRPLPPTTPVSLREKIAWGLAFAAATAGLIWLLWPVFSLLFAGAALAYLLDPVVDRFEARGRSREGAIGVLFAGAFAALLLGGLIVIPAVSQQLHDLSSNVSAYFDRLNALVAPAVAWVEAQTGVHVPVDLDELRAAAPTWLQKLSPDARQSIQDTISGLFTSGMGFITAVLNLALLPIFTFYLLRDWDRLVAGVASLVPPRSRGMVGRLATEVDERLGAFVRGQITICLVLGLLYSLGLWIAGIDLPFIIGMSAGILFIVPYLGTVVGIVLAALLSLMKYGLDAHLLYVAIVFGGVQLFEGWWLTPTIVGDKVGLHPLVVMVALIAGGSLMGIWGMLLAIPVTAILSVLGSEGLRIYRASAVFREEG